MQTTIANYLKLDEPYDLIKRLRDQYNSDFNPNHFPDLEKIISTIDQLSFDCGYGYGCEPSPTDDRDSWQELFYIRKNNWGTGHNTANCKALAKEAGSLSSKEFYFETAGNAPILALAQLIADHHLDAQLTCFNLDKLGTEVNHITWKHGEQSDWNYYKDASYVAYYHIFSAAPELQKRFIEYQDSYLEVGESQVPQWIPSRYHDRIRLIIYQIKLLGSQFHPWLQRLITKNES